MTTLRAYRSNKKTYWIFSSLLATGVVTASVSSFLRTSPTQTQTQKLLDSKLATPLAASCGKPVRVNFFGDIYIAESKTSVTPKLFSGVLPLLNWADFNVANFEGVVTNSKTRAFPTFPFALKMPGDVPKLLSGMGIRYVTRANNHSMDFGIAGMMDTNAALSAAGVSFAGVGSNLEDAFKPMVLNSNGLRIAIVSLNMTYPEGAWATPETPGVAYPVIEKLKPRFANIRADNDFVVVVFHWGEELSQRLRPYQSEMATAVVSWGADAVFGHHAHIAQATETVLGKPVGYGLGNFVFTAYSQQAKFGLAAHAEFCRLNSNERKVRVAYSPLNTYNYDTSFVTKPMTKAEFKSELATYLENETFSLNTLFYLHDEKKTLPLSDWVKRLNIALK